jgi:hypothetical protein
VAQGDPTSTETRGELGLTVIDTYHPGRQALWHKDPGVRAERLAHQVAAFQWAAAVCERRA